MIDGGSVRLREDKAFINVLSAAIGARTTESQIHRELASGMSMPVGFKVFTSPLSITSPHLHHNSPSSILSLDIN